MATIQHTCSDCIPIDASILEVYIQLLDAIAAASEKSREQSDWAQTNPYKTDFIKNKPDLSQYVTEEEIAGLGNVFVAVSGTTTYAEISAALDAGKAVFLKRIGAVLPFTGTTVEHDYVFTGVDNAVELSQDTNVYVAIMSPSGVINSYRFNLVMWKDVITTLNAQSTNSQVPGAKCVYDAIAEKYSKPVTGIPASDMAEGVIPTVPTISTDISADANSDTKTASPKAVKTYVDTGIASVESDISDLADEVEAIDIGAYVVAWDGNSTPVVADIPAGVTVTYNTTSYTGTLAASASTIQKIYLVATGTTDNYDRYITVGDSTYSWINLGTTEITLADYATKAEVTELELKVDDLSTGKYYGYYATSADLPDDATVDGFAYVGSGPTYTIYNCEGGVWTSSGITVNQSPIGNDEDIDQNSDGKLQFANRVYDSLQPNGMGYKILRQSSTFADQVTDTNTIYEIRYPFDLNSASVTIPTGCVLRFNGGKVSNGTLVLQDTVIESKEKCFDGVSFHTDSTIKGNQVNLSWFANEGDDCADILNVVCNFTRIRNVYLDLNNIKISHPVEVTVRNLSIRGFSTRGISAYDSQISRRTTITPTSNYSASGYSVNSAFIFTVPQPDVNQQDININGGYKIAYGLFYYDTISGYVRGMLIQQVYLAGICVIGNTENTYFIRNRIYQCGCGFYFNGAGINENNLLDLLLAGSPVISSNGSLNWFTLERNDVLYCNFGLVMRPGSSTNLVRNGFNHCSCYGIYAINNFTTSIEDMYIEGNGRSSFWISSSGVDGSFDGDSVAPYLLASHYGERNQQKTGWGVNGFRTALAFLSYGRVKLNYCLSNLNCPTRSKVTNLTRVTDESVPGIDGFVFTENHLTIDNFNDRVVSTPYLYYIIHDQSAGSMDKVFLKTNRLYRNLIVNNISNTYKDEEVDFKVDGLGTEKPEIVYTIVGGGTNLTLHKELYKYGVMRNVVNNVPLFEMPKIESSTPGKYYSFNYFYIPKSLLSTGHDYELSFYFKTNKTASYLGIQLNGTTKYVRFTSGTPGKATLYLDRAFINSITGDYIIIYNNNTNLESTDYIYLSPMYLHQAGVTKDYDFHKVGLDYGYRPIRGIFADVPTLDDTLDIGFKYFCTDRQTTEGATDGIEIFYQGNGVWADALGRTVS